MRARRIVAAAAGRKVIGYVRVSTDEQASQGVSLDAQDARIRAYAVAQAREIDEMVVDAGQSAKTLQRPGIARILAAIRAGEVEALVVLKLDRLTRSTRDLADLLDLTAKHDVALVSLSESLDTSTAAGRMVVSMLGVVAQWEREAISERTASALGHKRAQGKVYGKTPFGYRRDGSNLVPDPATQLALAEMIRLDRAGASYREIGAMLEARNIATSQAGARWYPSSVRAVLRSKSTTAAA
jgi:DNA invertase Pin-like site-specific DNA recombinase